MGHQIIQVAAATFFYLGEKMREIVPIGNGELAELMLRLIREEQESMMTTQIAPNHVRHNSLTWKQPKRSGFKGGKDSIKVSNIVKRYKAHCRQVWNNDPASRRVTGTQAKHMLKFLANAGLIVEVA